MKTSKRIKVGSNRRLKALADVFINPGRYPNAKTISYKYHFAKCFIYAAIKTGYISKNKNGLMWSSEAEPSLELVKKIRGTERGLYRQGIGINSLEQKSDLSTPQQEVTPHPFPETINMDSIIDIVVDLLEKGLTGDTLKEALRCIAKY